MPKTFVSPVIQKMFSIWGLTHNGTAAGDSELNLHRPNVMAEIKRQ